MKTITVKIVMPEWKKVWMATDKDGRVVFFNNEPGIWGQWWQSTTGGRLEVAGQTIPPKDFRKTLRRIK